MTIKKTTVNKNDLKKYLLDKINQPDNILEIEKVNRYIQFVDLIAKLKKDIKKQGETIVVENGSQRYIKTHPAIAEISKLNTSMLAIERTWNFKVDYAEDFDEDLI
ncbi:P27 family phage terminase small subunit [Gemella massiliensis]|uniref:P27 family phage terminase small subunit n=1 Tax=Gemella massiliensis TaxID=1909670 RepID=UPI0009308B27|nr:P27 family phage terminase small subunit [Gemella massiliensis]